MVTISNIAQRILDENHYQASDIHATAATAITRVEYMVDNSIDYINLMAGTTISHVSSNDLTADYDEIMVVKILSTLMIRAYLDRGPNASAGILNAAAVIADPQYQLFTKIVNRGINRLRGRSFVRT